MQKIESARNTSVKSMPLMTSKQTGSYHKPENFSQNKDKFTNKIKSFTAKSLKSEIDPQAIPNPSPKLI